MRTRTLSFRAVAQTGNFPGVNQSQLCLELRSQVDAELERVRRAVAEVGRYEDVFKRQGATLDWRKFGCVRSPILFQCQSKGRANACAVRKGGN
jgi:hypothetical protein